MQTQNTTKHGAVETTRLHAIDSKRKRGKVALDVTGMNQHVRASVVRVAIDCDDDVRTLRKAAERAGVREPQALAAVRQYVYDLRTQIYHLQSMLNPLPPSGPAAVQSRAFGGGMLSAIGRKAA